MPITAQITVSKVVHKNQNEIGSFRLCLCEKNIYQEKQYNSQAVFFIHSDLIAKLDNKMIILIEPGKAYKLQHFGQC